MSLVAVPVPVRRTPLLWLPPITRTSRRCRCVSQQIHASTTQRCPPVIASIRALVLQQHGNAGPPGGCGRTRVRHTTVSCRETGNSAGSTIPRCCGCAPRRSASLRVALRCSASLCVDEAAAACVPVPTAAARQEARLSTTVLDMDGSSSADVLSLPTAALHVCPPSPRPCDGLVLPWVRTRRHP